MGKKSKTGMELLLGCVFFVLALVVLAWPGSKLTIPVAIIFWVVSLFV